MSYTVHIAIVNGYIIYINVNPVTFSMKPVQAQPHKINPDIMCTAISKSFPRIDNNAKPHNHTNLEIMNDFFQSVDLHINESKCGRATFNSEPYHTTLAQEIMICWHTYANICDVECMKYTFMNFIPMIPVVRRTAKCVQFQLNRLPILSDPTMGVGGVGGDPSCKTITQGHKNILGGGGAKKEARVRFEPGPFPLKKNI